MPSSRTRDNFGPAVRAFLDAADQRLNANAYLLAVEADESLSDGAALTAFFAAWLRSPLFVEMIQEARSLRGWRGRTKAKKGGGLPAPPVLRPLTASDLARRIWWILQEAPSPYDVEVTQTQARRLIRELFRELFGPDAWQDGPREPLHGLLAEPVMAAWQLFDVSVPALKRSFRGYFDELGADSATLFARAQTVYVLLTNGTD